MPWADLFRWCWQFGGGLILAVLFVGAVVAAPHKTNRDVDRFNRY